MLQRYGNIDYFMDLPFDTGVQLILRAQEQKRDERIFLQWAVQLPFMDPQKPVSFPDYKDRVTGKNLDLRPASEILAELDEVEQRLTGGATNGP